MTTIKIHNVQTGEIIEREMNAQELAQLEADAQAEAAAQAKRLTALAKLEALGIDEADLTALGL
jgi:D-alanyl-D-alanine carboxypeptidase